MAMLQETTGEQIIIYQPFIYRRHSGYGLKSECLKLAFPMRGSLLTQRLSGTSMAS